MELFMLKNKFIKKKYTCFKIIFYICSITKYPNGGKDKQVDVQRILPKYDSLSPFSLLRQRNRAVVKLVLLVITTKDDVGLTIVTTIA